MHWNLARTPVYVAAAVMLCSPFAVAENPADRVQVGRSIVVQPGESAGDLVCVGCSIRVRGQTSGDVVAVAGNITVESEAKIAGDAVAVAGGVRLEKGAQVRGNAVTVGGRLYRDPDAVISREVSVRSGGWLLPIFLVPLLVVGGVVAFIIWLIQRGIRPAQVPAYPGATPNIRP